MSARALIVAKAPVIGEVKTRLGAEIGMAAAADLAAAALLDTMAACQTAFGAESCFLALAGDLSRAERSNELAVALEGWKVFDQRGDDFAARLVHAHTDIPQGSPVVQVGMDTPQVRAEDLRGVAAGLADADAVLGPADDGGWWVLALTSPEPARVLRAVAMSTATTYDDTRRALRAHGVRVASAQPMRDVDTATDAAVVAGHCPATRFARAWQVRAR